MMSPGEPQVYHRKDTWGACAFLQRNQTPEPRSSVCSKNDWLPCIRGAASHMFVQWMDDHKHLYPDTSAGTGCLLRITVHGSQLWTQLSSPLQNGV